MDVYSVFKIRSSMVNWTPGESFLSVDRPLRQMACAAELSIELIACRLSCSCTCHVRRVDVGCRIVSRYIDPTWFMLMTWSCASHRDAHVQTHRDAQARQPYHYLRFPAMSPETLGMWPGYVHQRQHMLEKAYVPRLPSSETESITVVPCAPIGDGMQ